jgi:hypothetical protein
MYSTCTIHTSEELRQYTNEVRVLPFASFLAYLTHGAAFNDMKLLWEYEG